eukprot:CAMPEP_0201890318 /NCGR_PEP_ID=MMETSP0902-20130614/31945_1 /ASSEMBLY_ACC=CAM_ASM_000551 /TAXON_ID=420261 /ORGANISM="Thalassiosira antarctica, Strain CCMP982" /LENGTH=248 /DNA_ID=CAMNT_0048421141 /DNA_START=56 /DNA_END=799 /DNA_ORIENTATION=-
MSSTDPVPVVPEERNEAAAEQKGDFFSMFYLPSSQSYEEDVHLATSSYSAPFQGAATALMGGILSVIDTALAVLNEEFDNPSDSIISESTKDDDEDGFQGSGDSCVTSKSSVLGCCKQTARSKLPTSCANNDAISSTDEAKASDNSEQSAEHESENNVHKSSIEQSASQEIDYFTPQNSLIGSISTLQLYEEGVGDVMKTLISDLHSKPMNGMEIEKYTDTVPESEISRKEDSEYCIIRNESETNDGW